MKREGRIIFIVVVYLLVLAGRLFFSFGTENLTGDESYFTLRQVENIKDTGLPLIKDDLSFGGRINIISPLYYYIIALFSYIMPIETAGKLVSNILANTIIFFTYLIVFELTRNYKVAIFTSVTSGFIPIFVIGTINTLSAYCLLFPLILATIYSFMNLTKGRRYVISFVILIIALSLTHISAYLVIFSFLIYALIIKLENLKSSQEEFEVILFSTLLVLWSQLLIYKKAFLMYGPKILFQNIPQQILAGYFEQISLVEAINKLGIIPMLFGIYIIYKYSFREKMRNVYILLSFIIVTMPLLWLRLIPLTFGLIMIGLILNILFGQYLKLFLIYIQKTKVSEYENLIISGFVLLFVVTSFIPTVFYARNVQNLAFSTDEIDALLYIKENSRRSDTVLASYKEGNLIAYKTGLKNVIDGNFLLIGNIDQRFSDVKEIYSTPINTDAISLLEKYSVDYVLVSGSIKETYGIDRMKASEDDICFRMSFRSNDVTVYEPLCRLETK